MQVLILPGYGNSGPDHWQTHWEKAHPEYRRVHQKHWENPRLADWLAAIDDAVSQSTASVILVAHSLACLAVAHWGQGERVESSHSTSSPSNHAARLSLQARVHGALLVAPPNPKAEVFPPDAADFGPVPQGALAFGSTLIYSSNDPFSNEAFSLECARNWHSEAFFAGALGHINSASRLEMWPQGDEVLRRWMEKV